MLHSQNGGAIFLRIAPIFFAFAKNLVIFVVPNNASG